MAKNALGVLPRGRAYETVMGASCKSRSWELVYTWPFTDHITSFQAKNRETIHREIRCIQIKKWYKDNIGWDYLDDLLDEGEAECPRNLAATARRASWDESRDNGEEKDDIESRRKEKEGNLGHESGQ